MAAPVWYSTEFVMDLDQWSEWIILVPFLNRASFLEAAVLVVQFGLSLIKQKQVKLVKLVQIHDTHGS